MRKTTSANTTAAAVVVALSFILSSGGDDKKKQPDEPIDEGNEIFNNPRWISLKEIVLPISNNDESLFYNKETYQYQSLYWLMYNDEFSSSIPSQTDDGKHTLIVRYVFATFSYSTYNYNDANNVNTVLSWYNQLNSLSSTSIL